MRSGAHWRCQRGIALMAVLWVVAILSLITVGLVQAVRTEVRIVGLDRQRVQAQALGEAAIALAAQQIGALQQDQPEQNIFQLEVEFVGQRMPVYAQPLAGLVSLPSAPRDVLAPVLQHAGGLSQDAALEMAERIVQWRISPTEHGATRGIAAPEDLLQVPGVSYDLYARVAPFVTASRRGTGLDLRAASPELLAMFGLQPGQLPAGQRRQAHHLFRFTAQVEVGQTRFEVRKDMQVNNQPGLSGMYWQTFESQIKVTDSLR